MIFTSVVLATFTLAGVLVIYAKLPEPIKERIKKYQLITDTLCLVAIYYILGGTLTALLAAALCGVLTSILLYIANNPDDFEFLGELQKIINTQLLTIKEYLNKTVKEYSGSQNVFKFQSGRVL